MHRDTIANVALKAVMENQLEDACRAITRRRDCIAVEQSLDTHGSLAYSVERELAFVNLSRESNLARQTHAA
jgi:hypothetical protein